MSIYSGPSLPSSGMQAASSKQDGGGNGSGGMFFGQDQQQDQYPPFNPFDQNRVDVEDIPFSAPLFGRSASSAMNSWKAMLALRLYQDIHDYDFEAAQEDVQ